MCPAIQLMVAVETTCNSFVEPWLWGLSCFCATYGWRGQSTMGVTQLWSDVFLWIGSSAVLYENNIRNESGITSVNGNLKGGWGPRNDPKLCGCRGMVTKSFKTCKQPQNELKVLVGIILLYNSDLSWSLSTVSTRNQQIVSQYLLQIVWTNQIQFLFSAYGMYCNYPLWPLERGKLHCWTKRQIGKVKDPN